MIINQDTQKKVLVSAILITLIFGGIGWLILKTEWISLANVGWFLLLVTIVLAIWIGRHISSKSTKKWLSLVIVLCIALILTYISRYQDNDDKNEPKNSENSGNSVPITSQKPTIPANPSIVDEKSFGRLVKFTGREPGGVRPYDMTYNGDQYEISVIGNRGIVDNSNGDRWPVWGADGFATGWREYFLYESMGITPNAVIIIFGGKPGDVPMDDEHIFTFPKRKTKVVVTSPGGPMYLYYHEPRIEQNSIFPYHNNNDKHFTIQIKELTS